MKNGLNRLYSSSTKSGISLIILVITIIVIVILAGAVMISLVNSNPMNSASKAKFASDIDTFQTQLELYKTSEYANKAGTYNPSLLNADKSTATYDGVKISQDATIQTIIPSMKGSYLDKFEIKEGKLILNSGTVDEKNWAEEIGIAVYGGKPKIMLSVDKTRVAPGTEVKYTIFFVTVETTNTVNLTGKVKLVNGEGQETEINVGQTSGTEPVVITLTTTNLTDGTYILKVLEGAVTSGTGLLSETKELSFEVDTTRPENPEISIAPSPISPTQEATITIDYFMATVKEYAITANIGTIPNDADYIAYTVPFTIQTNEVIWARSKNELGTENQTVSTLEVTNIDRVVPQDATINVTSASDTISGTITLAYNISGINITQSKYIVTTSSAVYTTDNTIWNTATTLTSNPQSISTTKADGDYYVHVLSVDRAGNKKANVSGKIVVTFVNAPMLTTGMTPIKWDDNGNVITTTSTDPSWYNYGAKQWANAKTADGSMWVWIPRYEYKIPTPHISAEQTIAVNFLRGTPTTATSGYTVHPAFIFGTTQLTGIWVAKFEASGTTSAVDVKPGALALSNISINDMFTGCRNMEKMNGTRYGWGTSGTGIDTHQMKNVEWGSTAYLSSSIYGKSGEVATNTNNSSYTGGGIGTAYISNISQSTTGNIYGIYDMSGGLEEYTASYVNNGSGNIITYASSLLNATDQYKDIYTSNGDTDSGNYVANSSKKGDAIYETSISYIGSTSWYNDFSIMPSQGGPFFARGGLYSQGGTGVFAFTSDGYGGAGNFLGFRPVLAISASL